MEPVIDTRPWWQRTVYDLALGIVISTILMLILSWYYGGWANVPWPVYIGAFVVQLIGLSAYDVYHDPVQRDNWRRIHAMYGRYKEAKNNKALGLK